MVQPLGIQRMRKRTHDVVLPDEGVERSRPVLAGQYEISHGAIVEHNRTESGQPVRAKRLRGISEADKQHNNHGDRARNRRYHATAETNGAMKNGRGRKNRSSENTRQCRRREREASLTSALLLSDCGCFVPDLTRFTAVPCEGARQPRFYQIRPHRA